MGWLELTELGERFADAPLESLEFQLREPAGTIVPTKHIAVQDTDRMIAMAEELEDDLEPDVADERFDDEFEAALIELGMSEPPVWDEAFDLAAESLDEPDLPRFQVYVELESADSVPIADRWKDDPDVREMLHTLRRQRDGSSA